MLIGVRIESVWPNHVTFPGNPANMTIAIQHIGTIMSIKSDAANTGSHTKCPIIHPSPTPRG